MTESPSLAAERILVVVSAATRMQFDSGESFSTGYWAGEFAVPYRALLDAGFAIDVATPGGQVPVPDPVSLGEGEGAARLLAYLESVSALKSPIALEEVDPTAYCAVVIPGGYAPMVDLTDSPAMARVLRSALERNALIAAICHAPAALLSVLEAGKPWPFTGYRMVSFTNAEEQAWLGDKRLAWQVEDRLRDAGAKFESSGEWASKIVLDRNLLTGQNSPSCAEFTTALLGSNALSRSS